MAVAHKPEDCDRLFMEAFNTGDLEGLVSLYEEDAAFVQEGGRVVRGRAAIREIMRGFFAQKLHFTIEATVTQNGDIALLNSLWTLSGTTPDGQAVSMWGNGTEVVRRQADGSWEYMIDNAGWN